MKGRTLNIGLVLIIITLTAYSFIQKDTTNTPNVCNSSSNTQKPAVKVKATNPQFFYFIGGDYNGSILKKELTNAESLSDIIIDYPGSWITDYVSVNISTETSTDKSIAKGTNEFLNAKQKKLLNSLDINSDVEIIVTYERRNSVLNEVNTHQLKINLTVVPQKEAFYEGGQSALMNYFEFNSKLITDGMELDSLKNGSFLFTISEEGKATNSILDRTSGYSEVDELMLNLLNNMPKWTPAENNSGEKVKQKFRFNFGAGGC